jgi:hypothetical protein
VDSYTGKYYCEEYKCKDGRVNVGYEERKRREEWKNE